MSEHATPTPTFRRLERSSDRVLAGVCGGLGRYFELNPGFFRLGFVVLTLLGGAGVLVYLAALLVMPEEGHERSLAEQVVSERRERPWPLVALALAAVAAAIVLSHATLWPAAGAGWVVVLVGAVVVLWASRGTRRASILLRLVVGAAILAATLFVAAIVLAFAWFDVSLGNGVGDRTYIPATAAAVQPNYHLGVGNLRIDLSHLAPGGQPLHIRARVDVGELHVIVPQGVATTVDGRASVGDVSVFDQREGGRHVEVQNGTGRQLTIDARVGAGQIDVVRAGS